MARGATIRTPMKQRLRELSGAPLSVVVWLLAVAGVVSILSDRAQHFEYGGFARSTPYEVSTSVDGSLESLAVDLYDQVESGQIVALLDGSELDARLATAEAVLEKLKTDLRASRVSLAAETTKEDLGWRRDLRNFEMDVESLRLDALGIEVSLAGDEAREQLAALAVARLEVLPIWSETRKTQLGDAQLRLRQVVDRRSSNQVLFEETRKALRSAKLRARAFKKNLSQTERASAPAILAPLQAAISVQARLLDELRVERDRLALRSPIAGSVSHVLSHPGQALLAGEPVVLVTRSYATEIVAYLPEQDPRIAKRRQTVMLARRSNPRVVAESVVLRISPTIEALPERLWKRPGVAEYGRSFVVAAVAKLALSPGEAVQVRFERDKSVF